MLPGGIASAHLDEGFNSLWLRMLYLRELGAQRPLDDALVGLPRTLPLTKVIETLKWPTTTGVLREKDIQRIGRQESSDCDGRLLNLIAWSRWEGLDVLTPPRAPSLAPARTE